MQNSMTTQAIITHNRSTPHTGMCRLRGKVTFHGQHLQVQQSHLQTNTSTDSKHTHTHTPWLQPPQGRHSEKHQTERSVSLFGRVQVQTCLLQSAHFTTLTLVYHSDRGVNTSRAQRSNTKELSRCERDNLMRGKVLRRWAFLKIYPLEIKMEQFDTQVKYLMSIKKCHNVISVNDEFCFQILRGNSSWCVSFTHHTDSIFTDGKNNAHCQRQLLCGISHRFFFQFLKEHNSTLVL